MKIRPVAPDDRAEWLRLLLAAHQALGFEVVERIVVFRKRLRP
jgi:hypothetical protein